MARLAVHVDGSGAGAAVTSGGEPFAAEQAAALLPQSRAVAAFHHVSAVLLLDPEVESIDTDALVLGDDREASDIVRALADRIPGVDAGRLRNAGQVEALTANLVSVNRRYTAHAGVRITDIKAFFWPNEPWLTSRANPPRLSGLKYPADSSR